MYFVWSKLSAGKWRDAWEERLAGFGGGNLVISDFSGGKTLRVEVYTESEAEARAIKDQFGGSIRKLKEQNWQELAQRDPIIVKIRDRLIVTSESNPEKRRLLSKEHPGRSILHVPAELAFGTGDHVTTAGCLRFLVDHVKELERAAPSSVPKALLDLGAGTGVLGLAARALGIDDVLAVDYDKKAVAVARRNAERHGWHHGFRIEQADVLEWSPPDERRYPVVTANLFYNVLIASFANMRRWVEADGIAIVSGILREQEASCLGAAEKSGWKVTGTRGSRKWVAAQLEPAS